MTSGCVENTRAIINEPSSKEGSTDEILFLKLPRRFSHSHNLRPIKIIYKWCEKSDFLPKDNTSFSSGGQRVWFMTCPLKPHFVSIKWGNPKASHSPGTAAFLLGVHKQDFQGGLHTTSSSSTALFGGP